MKLEPDSLALFEQKIRYQIKKIKWFQLKLRSDIKTFKRRETITYMRGVVSSSTPRSLR